MEKSKRAANPEETDPAAETKAKSTADKTLKTKPRANTRPADRPLLRAALEVERAKIEGRPLVALESTVITHGLPWPQNLQLGKDMEAEVAKQGAVPATVAVLGGQLTVGLSPKELESLAKGAETGMRKVSLRDLGAAAARHESGGTTVAATMYGIRVFATGGIGGVHRDAPFDVSADLPALGSLPVLVVCAGAKSLLDIPATVEYLETLGVPIIGYQTDHFPAFFSPDSGLKVEVRADSPNEVATIAEAHWGMGLKTGILLVVPPPEEASQPYDKMEKIIQKALKSAKKEGVKGNKVTPYLLAKVAELSGGESIEANLALLLNNARVAGQIAAAISRKRPVSRLL